MKEPVTNSWLAGAAGDAHDACDVRRSWVAVGNAGFAGRVDYTIVGRTVNVAQALEQCGRQVIGDSEVIILASDATARSAGEAFAFHRRPEVKVSGAAQALRMDHEDQR